MKKLENIKKLSLNKRRVAILSKKEAHGLKGGRSSGPPSSSSSSSETTGPPPPPPDDPGPIV